MSQRVCTASSDMEAPYREEMWASGMAAFLEDEARSIAYNRSRQPGSTQEPPAGRATCRATTLNVWGTSTSQYDGQSQQTDDTSYTCSAFRLFHMNHQERATNMKKLVRSTWICRLPPCVGLTPF
eukprot:831205-Pleurochrysis_carterae.AAC.1